jgi:integrase
MAATRTPGITVDANGHLLIDKRHCGIRIIRRLGATTQEQAERRLLVEMQHAELARFVAVRPSFADCAVRYLAQCQERRSLEAIRIHVRLLLSHVGHFAPRQIHDATLAPLIADRLAAGASATTINRTLEVARTILNRAARSYRDDDGRPWLEATPPLITMLRESRRSPYPLTWDEQDRLFPRLPAHLQPMALFAVNTGLRNNNVCGLEWNWEVAVPEIGRSVFVVPAESFKGQRDHVVILNDAAWSIVQARRGLHPVWVFPYRGHRIGTMNNNGWQKARREVGLRPVRVHDLRHTFACRLRAAGVSQEDRCALLGHAEHSMSGHYASADVGRLLRQANLVLNRQETRTVMRVANGAAVDTDLWTRSPAEVPQFHGRLGLVGPSR